MMRQVDVARGRARSGRWWRTGARLARRARQRGIPILVRRLSRARARGIRARKRSTCSTKARSRQRSSSARTSLPELTRAFVRTGVSVMPPFRKTEISDADLAALAAYLAPKAP